MEWISIKERTPETNTEVIGLQKATNGQYFTKVRVFFDGNGFKYIDLIDKPVYCGNINHWTH